MTSSQGVPLSQANKNEIARLVLSSIKKQHFQPPATAALLRHQLPHARVGRSKFNKRARRRRKPGRSTYKDPAQYDNAEPAHLYGRFPSASQKNANMLGQPCVSPRDPNVGAANTTTVIRQRVEKQDQHVEVSVDGLWLPSLPSSGSSDAGIRHSSDGAARWAEPTTWAFSSPASLLSRQADSIDNPSTSRKCKVNARPVTVALQAPCSMKHVGEDEFIGSVGRRRSGAVTAGKSGHSVQRPDAHQRKSLANCGPESSWGCDETEGNSDKDAPVDDKPVALLTNGPAVGDTGSDSARHISQHTSEMLKRSRELVERAKVGYTHYGCRSDVVDGLYNV